MMGVRAVGGRQTDRQRNRQTDRHTHTHRQADGQTNRQIQTRESKSVGKGKKEQSPLVEAGNKRTSVRNRTLPQW